ncbi:hypothetical protein BDM02DRAFT_1740676 [Thelephora ganbajun]|uniref:Uncharacterized protein n=1 Tax=Thelephora ganbajun TaxID=370292 RepID=A0ACB6ZKA8_THEGA|nr:hypothetical protein BDM02DRAFT_1740676 [Thelephora ganbajun]
MMLLPPRTKRVNDATLQVWCQFVPHHSKGGNDVVMNNLVYRKLVQRPIDQCLYFMGRPKPPGSLDYPPVLTLQHIRVNRSRPFKRRKSRTPDTVRANLSHGSNFTLRRPNPIRRPKHRTPILLTIQRSDTGRGKKPIPRRNSRPCGHSSIRV